MKCLWQGIMLGSCLGILGSSSSVSALPFRVNPAQVHYYTWGGYANGPCCTAAPCMVAGAPTAACPAAAVTPYSALPGQVLSSGTVTSVPLSTADGQTLQSAPGHQTVRPLLAPAGSSQTSSAISNDPRMDALMERLNRIEELLILHEKYLQEQREQRLK